jgi:hypothetical protein
MFDVVESNIEVRHRVPQPQRQPDASARLHRGPMPRRCRPSTTASGCSLLSSNCVPRTGSCASTAQSGYRAALVASATSSSDTRVRHFARAEILLSKTSLRHLSTVATDRGLLAPRSRACSAVPAQGYQLRRSHVIGARASDLVQMWSLKPQYSWSGC